MKPECHICAFERLLPKFVPLHDEEKGIVESQASEPRHYGDLVSVAYERSTVLQMPVHNLGMGYVHTI